MNLVPITNSYNVANVRARNEPELRAMIVQALQASGITVEEQVVCAVGAADIVTAHRDVVIEVKLDLTRKQIQQAVGQVLLYRAAINPQARAIIIGYATPETAQLVDWVTAVGVEVVAWAEGEQSTDEIFSAPSSFRSQPFTLAWNVQTLALSHGISRLSDLAHFLGLPRQGLYGVWRGTAVNVSVARLERLAKRLGAGPDQPLRVGDWYRWDSKGRLVWGIKEVAEQIGLDAAQLAFAASQYPQQIALFWEDKAKFVFVDTLARLAAALETKERPFDIGEMFVKVWDW